MKVGNPRSIPEAIRIFVTLDGTPDVLDWFEGDLWVKPAKMPKSDEQDLITKGFLVADDA